LISAKAKAKASASGFFRACGAAAASAAEIALMGRWK
jgi:hypothetical protein